MGCVTLSCLSHQDKSVGGVGGGLRGCLHASLPGVLPHHTERLFPIPLPDFGCVFFRTGSRIFGTRKVSMVSNGTR